MVTEIGEVMLEKHVSIVAHELLTAGSEHKLSKGGREVLVEWTKSLIESGFHVSLPETTVVEIVSDLCIRAILRDDATIQWTARFSGDTGPVAQLSQSHFSSEPVEIETGVIEMNMMTTDIMYGSENAVMNLIQG